MSAAGRMWREEGFTLIEALTTVAIAAMIGAILFPLVGSGVAGAAFLEASSGVRADLRMARAQAVASGHEVEMIVDAQGDGYGWTPGPQRILIAGLALSPAGQGVRFYPDGSSSGAVLVLSQGAQRARFDVAPETGLPRGVS